MVYFGWFGDRSDDVLNYVPARITWLLMSLTSFVLPTYSGKKSFTNGLLQHSLIPGPNAGWSECAAAGSLQIKIAGPIYKAGVLVNEKWIGFENDRLGGTSSDVKNMNELALGTLFSFTLVTSIPLFIYILIR